MKAIHLLLASTVFTFVAAHAQVYKCKDAAGRIVFSDRGCDSNQTGARVQEKTTQQQRMQADWDAYVANNEKIMRRQRESERQAAKDAFYAEEHARQAAQARDVSNSYERAQRQQRASVQSTQGSPNSAGGRGMTIAQREAALASASTKRERDALIDEANTVHPGARGLTASQRSASKRLIETDLDKPIPADKEMLRRASNTPTTLVGCSPGGCSDTNGNWLNSAGGGNFTSSDGRFCARISSNQVMCN